MHDGPKPNRLAKLAARAIGHEALVPQLELVLVDWDADIRAWCVFWSERTTQRFPKTRTARRLGKVLELGRLQLAARWRVFD